MKNYLVKDPWHIIEDKFHPEYNRISESIFSIGNGHMGMRGNFEESYSGKTLQGTYMAGVYYPDKTIVGWWKNGYPEYFAKVLNSTNWIGLEIQIDDNLLDLSNTDIQEFKRDLDMKRGLLSRSFRTLLPDGTLVVVETCRFVSLARPELGALTYSITCPHKSVKLKVKSYLDGNVHNEDANYNEFFWEHLFQKMDDDFMAVSLTTRKTDFTLCVTAAHRVLIDDRKPNSTIPVSRADHSGKGYTSRTFELTLEAGKKFTLEKYASCMTTRDHPREELEALGKVNLSREAIPGFSVLKDEHSRKWEEIWAHSDLVIDGEIAAQQGIRFNIFQLNQTYTGKDARLNIGPKGFTGEKYGGSTYWDTEAYCLPFYLGTSDPAIARNLLKYRHNHLERAIENGEKLGFTKGAALYPMVTMNGEECHNEWEITFEEIHRNGAIAYAIYNYINCTGDNSYMAEYGLDVLIGISRFWVQRATFSKAREKYVILGVTGPNEYENNVNNNWYTNRIASWCLSYTRKACIDLEKKDPEIFNEISHRLKLTEKDLESFERIGSQMYYPADEKRGIFLQQDGYLDKEDITVEDLSDEERPIHQNWSWDRILRSPFIKQADTLQGLFIFEDEFDKETIKRNFDFYEPRTVHESSLSPCVHSILAASLGYTEKAYEMYLRTARLDLDDYNNDTEDGCHTTSMSGSWMAIVIGFGGLRYQNTRLKLSPTIPGAWSGYSFKLFHLGRTLTVKVDKTEVSIGNSGSEDISILLYNKEITIPAGGLVSAALKKV
ncbi:MAG: glycoside hydrolase family 65 protein [Spirochaetales bacterium]|nr:glycoside hydrolase family 65 protein [Spirochaetales bacterium]